MKFPRNYPLSGLRVVCREGWPLAQGACSGKRTAYGCSGILEFFEDAVSWKRSKRYKDCVPER